MLDSHTGLLQDIQRAPVDFLLLFVSQELQWLKLASESFDHFISPQELE
jgi:hypothetical protein